LNTLNKTVWITLKEANAPLALVGTSRKVPSTVIFMPEYGETAKKSDYCEKKYKSIKDENGYLKK
jgi:hypothetical protein